MAAPPPTRKSSPSSTCGRSATAGPNSNQPVPPARVFTAPDSNPRRFNVTLRVTDSGGAIDEKQVLVSVNNTPPAVEITSPLPGTLYSMTQDEVHVLSADISDLEHGPGELACAWQFALHHNDHSHVEPVDTNCEAMAPTSPAGCDGNTYFFRATLTVTDAHGLATTRAVDLLPNCTNAQADLGVSMTDAPDPVLVGGSITYSITVANTGTNNVEGVTVTDTLPPGTTLLSAPGYCSLAAGKVICSLGAFGVGQSESLSLVVRAPVAGTLVNTVEVTSLTAESNAANNTVSASTLVKSNEPPFAHAQSVSLAEDTSRALTLTGSDPEGGALTFQIATGPAHGSLAGAGASRTYTPAANYNGADGFTFTVRDPSGNTSAPAAVSISVSPVNDAPVATPQALSLAEDTSRPLTLTGSDVDGGTLVFSVVSGPAHGALTGAPPNLTYTPHPNFFGADSFVFRVSDGQAFAQATVSLSVTDVPEPVVWTGGDVGGPGVAGGFALNGGTFSINGSGADIWGQSDQFHFVRQSLAGDATIVARVVSLTNTNPGAKAGVMIRESLAAGSRHVMVVKTRANGTALQRRQVTSQASVSTAGVNAGFPYWVRLTRSGNVFTGFTSPDGTVWTSLGSVTVNMATAYAGLAVTSHDNTRVATAVIDNVTLTLGARQCATHDQQHPQPDGGHERSPGPPRVHGRGRRDGGGSAGPQRQLERHDPRAPEQNRLRRQRGEPDRHDHSGGGPRPAPPPSPSGSPTARSPPPIRSCSRSRVARCPRHGRTRTWAVPDSRAAPPPRVASSP